MKHPNKILKDFKKLHLLYEQGEVFTAFDTETTAISPKYGRVLEIGAVKFNKDGIISKFQQLFNPQCEISPFITELTGIAPSDVINCPVIKDYLPDFLDFIKDTILVAHNAQFDLNFINAECELAGLNITNNKTIDTLQFSRWFYPDFEKHKLDFLAKELKINPGHSHRAYDDARVCMELFIKMCKQN